MTLYFMLRKFSLLNISLYAYTEFFCASNLISEFRHVYFRGVIVGKHELYVDVIAQEYVN